MVDFKQAWQTALSNPTVSIAFQEADRDLHEVITKAAEALADLTEDHAALRLAIHQEHWQGITYALRLTVASHGTSGVHARAVDVGAYFVPSTGYPIQFGPVPHVDTANASAFPCIPSPADQLPTRGALELHLLNMITEPDSPIRLPLTFILRQT